MLESEVNGKPAGDRGKSRRALLDSSKAEDAVKPLKDYLRRDSMEKVLDSLKNETDSGRARIHSQAALEGRLFIFMLGLVLRPAMLAPRGEERA